MNSIFGYIQVLFSHVYLPNYPRMLWHGGSLLGRGLILQESWAVLKKIYAYAAVNKIGVKTICFMHAHLLSQRLESPWGCRWLPELCCLFWLSFMLLPGNLETHLLGIFSYYLGARVCWVLKLLKHHPAKDIAIKADGQCSYSVRFLGPNIILLLCSLGFSLWIFFNLSLQIL